MMILEEEEEEEEEETRGKKERKKERKKASLIGLINQCPGTTWFSYFPPVVRFFHTYKYIMWGSERKKTRDL